MNRSKLRSLINEEGIIFSFSGLISQSLTSFMIRTVQDQLDETITDTTMKKAIFLISAEQLQNVMSYSKNKNLDTKSQCESLGSFTIGFDKDKEKYFITSSNEIDENDKEKIIKSINFINAMKKEQLRKFLREQLRTGENKHDRGAGVGFIEMAKRSSEKLEYSFETLDDKLYFHILAYI